MKFIINYYDDNIKNILKEKNIDFELLNNDIIIKIPCILDLINISKLLGDEILISTWQDGYPRIDIL